MNRLTLLPRLIIVLFGGITFAYSIVVPPFETPDEVYHYAFARHLALGNGLPVQTVEGHGPWEHEGTQAPLYYLLLSRLIAPLDHSDFDRMAQVNERANLGDPLYPGNKNYILYSTNPLPLRGTNLAVHIGRWFSLGLSLLTLWLIYKIAQLAFPAAPQLAVLTLFIPATIPQFAFISASVSNDALVILLCTAVLHRLIVFLNYPVEQPITLRNWTALGVLLGLAVLSKLPALGLLPLTGMVLAGLAWRRKDWRLLAQGIPILAVLVTLIAGWWYWRNYSLYGDALAVRTLLEIEGLRTTESSWQQFWGELRGLRYSFWAIFGWFSILLPTWIYRLLDVVTLLAGVGWLLAIGRLLRRRPLQHAIREWSRQPIFLTWLTLVVWAGMLIALMLYWLTFAISSQGRLLFPALGAYSALLVFGLGSLWQWVRQGRWRWGRHGSTAGSPRPRASIAPLFALPVGLCLTSIYALLVLLPQSYHAAPPVAEIPATAEQVGRIHAGKMEVVAVEIPPGPYTAGNTVPVTLYLRKLQDTDTNYQMFVQLLDQEYKELANVTTHPGWGKNPTVLWEVGEVYADSYDLLLLRDAPGDEPIQARLYVGFIDPGGNLLEVPGYDWDIAARTIGYVLVQ